MRWIHDQHHADATVEYPVHFAVCNLPLALQPVKNRRTRPGLATDDRANAIGQNAGNIFHQTSAGDVRHAFDRHTLQYRQDRLAIDARRLQQRLRERAAAKIAAVIGAAYLDDAPHQRIAVGVRSARCQAEYHITRDDSVAIDDRGFFHNADRETGFSRQAVLSSRH